MEPNQPFQRDAASRIVELGRYVSGDKAEPSFDTVVEREAAVALRRWWSESLEAPSPVRDAASLEQNVQDLLLKIRASRVHTPKQSLKRWPAIRIAAVGLAVCVVVAASTAIVTEMSSPSRFSSEGASLSRQYSTTSGSISTLRLPDGTEVRLAPESRLRYSIATKGHRVVKLEGQALFSVQSHPSRSFVVETNGVKSRALGTVFDVRRYASDSITTVAVFRGRIETKSGLESVILSEGDIGEATDSSVVRVNVTRADTTAGWVVGELIFRRAPVRVVLLEASRWSGYTFTLADSSLGDRRVTTTLPVNEPAQMMHFLKDLLDVEMTFRGNVVTLQPRGNSPPPAAQKVRDLPHPVTLRAEVVR